MENNTRFMYIAVLIIERRDNNCKIRWLCETKNNIHNGYDYGDKNNRSHYFS